MKTWVALLLVLGSSLSGWAAESCVYNAYAIESGFRDGGRLIDLVCITRRGERAEGFFYVSAGKRSFPIEESTYWILLPRSRNLRSHWFKPKRRLPPRVGVNWFHFGQSEGCVADVHTEDECG